MNRLLRLMSVVRTCVFVGTIACLSNSGLGQSAAIATSGIRLSEPIETEWEFGLTVHSTGNSRRITASVPIPMAWPEQEIEIIEEHHSSKNVGKFKFQNPTRESRQFTFSINRMEANSSATAKIRFRILKKMILAPENTSEFKIPLKPSSRLATFLKPSPFIESRDERIREIADKLLDSQLSGWGQAEKNYRWVRENIVYKFDTQIHSCLEALEKKQGDCEELSSLFIALCRAQRIPARAVWIPGHTYPEFYLEDSQGKGHWFPCQAAGSYEFGAMTESKPILQKGDRFRIKDSNNRTMEARYLRPTLICRQPGGQLSMEWIQTELKNDSKVKGTAETQSSTR